MERVRALAAIAVHHILLCHPGELCGVPIAAQPITLLISDTTIVHAAASGGILCVRAQDSGTATIGLTEPGGLQEVIDVIVDANQPEVIVAADGTRSLVLACDQPLARFSSRSILRERYARTTTVSSNPRATAP